MKKSIKPNPLDFEGISTAGELRERIWSGLVRHNQAAYPMPPHGHNPNFKGARAAAKQLVLHPKFLQAQSVLVGMEAALMPVREHVLAQKKILFVPHRTKANHFWQLHNAPKGAGKLSRLPVFGEDVQNILPEICVLASVAIDETGARLSKGFGFGHAGFAALPILSVAHELMVLPRLPCPPDSRVIGFATPRRLLIT